MTPERMRKLRKLGLHGGVGLVVFIIAFYTSLPYDRFRDQVVALASQRDLDVEIASAGPTLGLGIAFRDIRIATRPTDGKPTRIHIDSARIGVSPLARLMGEDAASLSAEALNGDIGLDYRGSKSRAQVRVKGRELAMSELPGVKEAINLPLAGKLDLDVDVSTVPNRMAETHGTLGWTCAGCAIGDGKAKLKVAGNPMLSEGLSVPQIQLGDFSGKLAIEKGIAHLRGVQAKSLDGEVSIEGEIRLIDPLPSSVVDLYVRFKPSDRLLKKSDKLALIMQLAEAGKQPDGYYGVRLTGSLGRLAPPLWARTSPFANAPAARPGASPRPSTRPAIAPPPAPVGSVDPAKDPTANLPRYPMEAPPPAPSAPPPPPPTAPTLPPAPAPAGEPDAE